MAGKLAEAAGVVSALRLQDANTGEIAEILAAVREYRDRGDDETRTYHATKGKFPGFDRSTIDAIVRREFGLPADGKPIGLRRVGEREAHKKRAVILRGNRIKPRRVRALWPGHVYFGESTLIFGMPKVGKSTIVNDLAARVTIGAPMPGEPDATTHDARSVVILTAEDDPETIVAPQLIAAGADMRNVFIVPSAKIGEDHAPLDLADDLAVVEGLLREHGLLQDGGTTDYDAVGLIIISPITAYLGKRASTNDVSTVRGILDPFIAMLRRRRVASINIGHPKKDAAGEVAMYQNLGSIGFVAVHRVVDVVLRDPEGHDRPRLLLRAGNNLEPDVPHGYAYRIVGATASIDGEGYPTTRTEWVGRDDRDPDELLRRAKEIKTETKAQRAEELLTRELAGGPRKARDIGAMADEAGISTVTLNRARAKVGVEASRTGPDGKAGPESWLRLPGSPGETGDLPF